MTNLDFRFDTNVCMYRDDECSTSSTCFCLSEAVTGISISLSSSIIISVGRSINADVISLFPSLGQQSP